jgi:flagellar basal-body rod modification protein FlgD
MRIENDLPMSQPTGNSALQPSRDEFLKLFVAQLRYQDPLNPSDPSKMVADLAQLSAVEQTAALGARLDALVAQQASSTRVSLLGLFGRTVEAPADQVTIRDDSPLPVVADLPRAASNLTVVVKDAAGQEVRRVSLGARPAGPAPLLDTLDLPPGQYQVEVQAVDANGAPMNVRPTVHGTVTSIAFSDGGTRLFVGGLTLDPADIASVS